MDCVDGVRWGITTANCKVALKDSREEKNRREGKRRNKTIRRSRSHGCIVNVTAWVLLEHSTTAQSREAMRGHNLRHCCPIGHGTVGPIARTLSAVAEVPHSPRQTDGPTTAGRSWRFQNCWAGWSVPAAGCCLPAKVNFGPVLETI